MIEDHSVLSRPAGPPDEVVSYGPEPEHVAGVRGGGERGRQRPLVVLIHGGFWRPDTDRAHTGPVCEVVMGHSAGGHLALWAAAMRPTQELVGALALGPVADLRLADERHLGNDAALAFLGASPDARADVDPCRMRSPSIATTIVHGSADEIVPLALSESYVAAHPRTRLVSLAGVGHFAVIDPLSSAWTTVMEELERLSRPTVEHRTR